MIFQKEVKYIKKTQMNSMHKAQQATYQNEGDQIMNYFRIQCEIIIQIATKLIPLYIIYRVLILLTLSI